MYATSRVGTDRIFNIFTVSMLHDLILSVLCHQGDAIKAKVRSCHINSPSQTKKDVGDDCNSFKLFKQFVIILGCDFLFKCRYI